MTPSITVRVKDNWILLHGVAIAAATAHALVDWHIGLFGATSATLSPSQAGIAIGMSVLTAFWGVSLAWASRGDARGHATALSIALLWGFAGNGLAIVGCLPPCPDGFPYQDISHVGSLLFGGGAAWASWHELKKAEGRADWLLPGIAVAVTVLVLFLEAQLAPVP